MSGSRSKVIVLADPPVARHSPQAAAFPNLGLLYLAASLRERFPDYRIKYIDGQAGWREHLALVGHWRPAFYGLSFASPYAGLGIALLKAVKTASPETRVLCGGAHPTCDPEGTLTASGADVACVGEGELTTCETIASCLAGSTPRGVAGTACREADGRVVRAMSRDLVVDLDDLPAPAWDLIDFRHYVGCRWSRGACSTAIIASRGCPYDCVFCSNPVWKVSKPWFRARSPENIVREVEALYRRGVREIYIRSDEMNADCAWAVAVFSALADLGHEDLVFQCNLRASPVTPALVDAMARARCWLCHIGIESASQRVLDGVRKHITLAEIREALALLQSRRIKTFGFFMLYQAWEDAGTLLVESTAEVVASLRFALELRWRGLLDYMSWSFATPYPNSALHRSAVKFHLVRENARRRSVQLPWDISLRLPGVATWEMAGMRGLGMLLQAGLFLSDRDSYNVRTAVTNLRQAAHKLRYAARI